MSENQSELKAQIKGWLKKQHMNRKEFAEKCFVSPNTVRNWLAKADIPKDKEALICLIMEKTEEAEKLREAARANWKPFAVMVSTEDYKLIEKAAALANMTVEEWAETTLIQDAQNRMHHLYAYEDAMPNDLSRVADEEEKFGSSSSSDSSSSSSSSSPSSEEPDKPRRKPRK